MILGLGLSGPQVVEGWYGRPFPKSPLAFTREYVDVVRQVLRRESPVEFDGRYVRHPYRGDDGTGLGKALRSITHPLRADLPVFLGAAGPKNVHLTTQIADGWLPLHWSPYNPDAYGDALRDKPDGFRVAPMVQVVVDDDLERAMRPVKASLAFYVGGMGAKDRNFHADLMRRFGHAEAADRIQKLFLDDRRDEAIAAVPDALVDEIALVGTAERIRDRRRTAGHGDGTHDPATRGISRYRPDSLTRRRTCMATDSCDRAASDRGFWALVWLRRTDGSRGRAWRGLDERARR